MHYAAGRRGNPAETLQSLLGSHPQRTASIVQPSSPQIAAEASTTRQNLIAESEALADQIVKGIVEGRAR